MHGLCPYRQTTLRQPRHLFSRGKNRFHKVVTTEVKKGLDLALIAEAALPHSAGKSNPIISIPQILDLVKDNAEFVKRIPVETVFN